MTAGPSDAETCLHVSISEANSHALRNDRLKTTVAATLAFCGSLSRILFPDSESGAIRVVIAQPQITKNLTTNHKSQTVTGSFLPLVVWMTPKDRRKRRRTPRAAKYSRCYFFIFCKKLYISKGIFY